MRGFSTPYAVTGEATIYAGEATSLTLEFQAPTDGSWETQDMADRVFKHRVLDADGDTLVEADSEIVTGEDDIQRARMLLTSAETLALLPEGETLIDLKHVVVEIVDIGGTDNERLLLAPVPFRVRKMA